MDFWSIPPAPRPQTAADQTTFKIDQNIRLSPRSCTQRGY
jgi:hypothetical protein